MTTFSVTKEKSISSCRKCLNIPFQNSKSADTKIVYDTKLARIKFHIPSYGATHIARECLICYFISYKAPVILKVSAEKLQWGQIWKSNG